MNQARSILVVGPSWVGDMVMAQSLFMTLQDQHPGLQIDVLAPQWSLPILQRMPQVRRGITMPLGHGQLDLRTRWRLGRELASHGYDQAIVLPGSLKSALVPWFAGIPVRTGFTGEMRFGLLNDRRRLDKQALPMTVQRFVALGLSPHPKQVPEMAPPQLEANADNAVRQLARLGLSTERPAVAFMPGAEYGPAKQWPAPHFAQLAKDLIARGQQVWILGSAKDRAVGETIAQSAASPHVHNLCGQTELGDVVDLLSLCKGASPVAQVGSEVPTPAGLRALLPAGLSPGASALLARHSPRTGVAGPVGLTWWGHTQAVTGVRWAAPPRSWRRPPGGACTRRGHGGA